MFYKSITIIFILAMFFSGCSEKVVKLEYPTIKLKNFGNAEDKIEIERTKKNGEICLTINDFNKVVFDMSLLKLNLKNHQAQTEIYNSMFNK